MLAPARSLAILLAALALVGGLALEASARGGGPGGGPGGGGGGPPMPGSRGTGPGRVQGGVGRIGDRAFGMGRFKQGSEKSLKEWESIQKQADRKKAIQQRRERSIEADRHASQEAFLAESRGLEAEQLLAESALR